MALAPQFATHRIGSANAAHTLELFLDLICPFSQKQLAGVREHLVPHITGPNPTLREHLSIVIRQIPQPWHASSTLVHEAVLGVSKVLAEGTESKAYNQASVIEPFQKFFFTLMDQQKDFYDEPTSKETPEATRARLVDLAVKTIDIDRVKLTDALKVGQGNGGTPVTANLKLAIKYGRQTGVHVTPTVALDGLIEGSVSSSFSGDDWKKFLEEKVLPSGVTL